MEASQESELSENFAFGQGSDQDLGLDLDSFGNTFGELGDLGSSSGDLSKPNLSHDDSCLDQPSCFSQIPNVNLFNVDHHPGSRHATQNFVNMPPSAVSFQNHQSQMVAMAHNTVQNNQSQQGQRPVGRSASFSMVSPQYGSQGCLAFLELRLILQIVVTKQHATKVVLYERMSRQRIPLFRLLVDSNRTWRKTLMHAVISYRRVSNQTPEMELISVFQMDLILLTSLVESDLFQFPVELPIWNHILSCHGQEQPVHCVSPCPAESPLVFGNVTYLCSTLSLTHKALPAPRRASPGPRLMETLYVASSLLLQLITSIISTCTTEMCYPFRTGIMAKRIQQL